MQPYLVASLYKFVPLPDYRELREPVREKCQEEDVVGSLLLASEGINGTLAGPEDGLRRFLSWLREDPRLSDLVHKESWTKERPFHRLKVRLKKEIVTMGVPQVDPNRRVGTYVQPKDWNDLIGDPDVVVIDTRNDYEVAIGTFQGAIDPQTESFSEFPDWVHKSGSVESGKKVAMFCTGGIRCEKASSYMVEHGFEEVYHLQGGILKYLEEVPESESMWTGECYVFDQRVAVKHGLERGKYVLCHACGLPLSPADMDSELYVQGVSCATCVNDTNEEQKERFAERQKQLDLAGLRREIHMGAGSVLSERDRSESESEG
jgi:UPF0176 protein